MHNRKSYKITWLGCILLKTRLCRFRVCVSVKQSRVPSGGWESRVDMTSNVKHYLNKVCWDTHNIFLSFTTSSKIRKKVAFSKTILQKKTGFWSHFRANQGPKWRIAKMSIIAATATNFDESLALIWHQMSNKITGYLQRICCVCKAYITILTMCLSSTISGLGVVCLTRSALVN